MAGSALAEARERFGTYAQQLDQFQERGLERIGAEEIAALSTMLRAADQLLAALDAGPPPDDPDLDEFVAWVRILRRATSQLLRVAGPDAIWSANGDQGPPALKLTARDSAFLAERLLNPPEPTEALRAAAARYRAMTGQLLSPLLRTL